jgi:hypothetical protein
MTAAGGATTQLLFVFERLSKPQQRTPQWQPIKRPSLNLAYQILGALEATFSPLDRFG